MAINRAHPLIQRIDKFLYSPAYFLYIGGLTILANVFCQELMAYTLLLLTGIYICLLARDLLPLLPIFACGYISPSLGNNPGFNDNSIFSVGGGGLYLAALLVVLAGILVYRLITDPVIGGKAFLTKKRTLLSGMLLLSATYVLSGLGSGQWAEYGWKNLLFAFLQFVAVAGLYYLLSGGVRWDLAPKAYLFWTGVCVGYVLVAELVGIYITNDVIVDGAIFRDNIRAGWGHYNNMGAYFAMMIPLPFFLTGKGKYAGFAYVSSIVFYLALLFTCSRGSMIVGTVIFVAGYVLSLVHSRHARLQKVVHSTVIVVIALCLAVFSEKILELFRVFGGLGIGSPERMETYVEGMKQFLKFPIFGGSFFPVDFQPHAWASSESFLSLFPPRWHNTFVQVLATGGVVCLVGYLVHRVQTVKMFVKDYSEDKLFAGLSVLALLMASMVDCHFFNVGPVLFYSATLAFVECKMGKK